MSFIYAFMLAGSAAASPISRPSLSKRAPSGRSIGIGFGITIALIVVALVAFSLGIHYGRTGSWKGFTNSWRNPRSKLSELPASDPTQVEEIRKIKSVSALPKGSTARSIPLPVEYYNEDTLEKKARPVELSPIEARPRLIELSPIEVPRPQFLEVLPNETLLVEAGGGTPRRGRFDRKSWFGRSKSQSRTRSRKGSAVDKEISIYEMAADPLEALPPMPPAYIDNKGRSKGQDREKWEACECESSRAREAGKKDEEDVDWSGIEFMRRMYRDRRSLHRGDK